MASTRCDWGLDGLRGEPTFTDTRPMSGRVGSGFGFVRQLGAKGRSVGRKSDGDTIVGSCGWNSVRCFAMPENFNGF